MEIKKDRQADMESKRLTAFLLGALFTLSLFFVVFEYRTPPAALPDVDTDALEEMLAEMELGDVGIEDDRIPLVQVEPLSSEAARTVVSDETAGDMSESVGMRVTDTAVTVPPFVPADDEAALTLPAEPVNAGPDAFRVVQDLPKFPGGSSELMRWLTLNLKYPEEAKKRKTEGEVITQFIVNTDGTISDIETVTHPGTAFENEALRVMRLMPAWEPGIQDGKPCRTMVRIPIVFKL